MFYWKAIECAVPLIFTGKWALGHSSDRSMLCPRWNVLSHANHSSITKSAFCYRLVFMLINAFMEWIAQCSFNSVRSNLCQITVSETWFSSSSWQQYRERQQKSNRGKKNSKIQLWRVCVCVCFVQRTGWGVDIFEATQTLFTHCAARRPHVSAKAELTWVRH